MRLPRTLVTDYQPELQHDDTATFKVQVALLPPCVCDVTRETPAKDVLNFPPSTRLSCAKISDTHASLGYYMKLTGLKKVLPAFVLNDGWFCAGKLGLGTRHLLQASSIHTSMYIHGVCSIQQSTVCLVCLVPNHQSCFYIDFEKTDICPTTTVSNQKKTHSSPVIASE